MSLKRVQAGRREGDICNPVGSRRERLSAIRKQIPFRQRTLRKSGFCTQRTECDRNLLPDVGGGLGGNGGQEVVGGGRTLAHRTNRIALWE